MGTISCLRPPAPTDRKDSRTRSIDSHKGSTPLFVLLLLWYYGQWENTTAWVYLALHGTYGVLWITKSRLFGDRQWDQACSIWYGLYIWAGLSLFWIAPWLIIAGHLEAAPWYLGACVSLYAMGLFWHFVADMQKHVHLALRPGLITSGPWARIRNPNYLGELMIYLSFGLLAMHWAPLVVIGLFVTIVWIPNMRRKDRSLSRYPEFAAYKRRSGLLFPF